MGALMNATEKTGLAILEELKSASQVIDRFSLAKPTVVISARTLSNGKVRIACPTSFPFRSCRVANAVFSPGDRKLRIMMEYSIGEYATTTHGGFYASSKITDNDLLTADNAEFDRDFTNDNETYTFRWNKSGCAVGSVWYVRPYIDLPTGRSEGALFRVEVLTDYSVDINLVNYYDIDSDVIINSQIHKRDSDVNYHWPSFKPDFTSAMHFVDIDINDDANDTYVWNSLAEKAGKL